MSASGTRVIAACEVAAIGPWMADAGRDTLFAAKSSFAVLLTGWLAMRFELEQPGTAMLTVAIVSHPQSGMVLAKSFYRAGGTLVGSLVALAIVAAFPQQRFFFLGALAAWIAICAAGASLQRNFRSYGFVLAGYTAAIVALPATVHPQGVFDSAVMRVSEVLLGLLVAGVVSDIVFPQRLSELLRENIRTGFAAFIAFVRANLGETLPRDRLRDVHVRFVREIVQIENQRSSVVFEDAGVRARSPRLRRFNHAFMAVSTSFQSLHLLLDRLSDRHEDAARSRLIELARALARALGPPGSEPKRASEAHVLADRLAVFRADEPTRVALVRVGVEGREQQLDFDTGAELLARIAAELHDYALAYADLVAPRTAAARAEPARFAHVNDGAGATLAMVRTALTMSAMGAFWIATAWPEGAGAMLIATIFSALMASTPDPVRAIRYMLVGYALGIAAGLFATHVVLVRMDGFALLGAALLPFLLPGFYLSTRASLPGIGAGYLLAFLYTVAIRNPMTFDALHSVNDSLGQLIGVACASIAFMLVPATTDSAWLRRRLLRKLRGQVVVACRAPLPSLLPRFESANRDIASQLVAHTPPGSDESRHLLSRSLAVLEIGRATIELRQALVSNPTERLRVDTDDAIAALADLYSAPTSSLRALALDRFTAAIETARDHPDVLTRLHLLRLALLDDDSVLVEALDRDRAHAA